MRRLRRRALPMAIAIIASLIVIADIAVTRSDSSAAGHTSATAAGDASTGGSANGSKSVLAPAASATKDSHSIRAGAASPIEPATPVPARVEGAPGTDPSAELTAMTSSLGADGVSVAALNLTSGATYNFGATSGMTMGSIAKLDILETLLLQHEDSHQALSDDDVTLAISMIEASDNDAADSLWAEIGSDPAVTAANQRLGVPTLAVGTGGYWGLGTTSAAQQLTLLNNLVSTGGPLDAPSQAFALGLMHNVESDQRWGVGSVADPGTVFANKNGWLANDADNDLWLINSDGIVTVHGQQLLISVLTQHDDSQDDGISLVEQIAAAVAPAVS
jgi:beta-lactamase class A